MGNKQIFSTADFARCVEFHGHTCPGLAIGFRAAVTLMKRLDVQRAPDEELVAVVETDARGADAIQVMTDCTFGKGNFIFKNFGKHAFSPMDRGKRKQIRVCLLPGLFKSDPDYLALSKKVQSDAASAKEIERFSQLQSSVRHWRRRQSPLVPPIVQEMIAKAKASIKTVSAADVKAPISSPPHRWLMGLGF